MDAFICDFCGHDKEARHVTKTYMHLLCEDCFKELPEEDQKECISIEEYNKLFNG